MAKVSYQEQAVALEEIKRDYFEELSFDFAYIEEEEMIPVSKGGFQKEIRFGLNENQSFGLVARLGKPSAEKESPLVLEVYVRIREDGAWKDYYDGILVPMYKEKAEGIARASIPMMESLRSRLEGMDILLVDKTNLPMERWEEIRKNPEDVARCKRLYRLLNL